MLLIGLPPIATNWHCNHSGLGCTVTSRIATAIKRGTNSGASLVTVKSKPSALVNYWIKKIAKILNIELINLPPYSPHLNPIEQLWRIMKNIIRNENLKSREHLKELVKKTFNENIEKNNITIHWCETFISKV